MEFNRNNLLKLKNAANYLNLRRFRKGGIGTLIWGIINIFIGLLGLIYDPINVVILIIAGFMIIVGIFVIISPNVTGLLLQGFTFLTVGLWNLFITFYDMFNYGIPPIGFSTMFGLMQLAWGGDYFYKYYTYKKKGIYKPSKDLLKAVKHIRTTIRKLNTKRELDAIKLKVFDKDNKGIWKGKLLADIAIFVSKKRKSIFFADINDVSIDVTGKKLLSNRYKIFFRMNGKKYFANISSFYYDRYESWKSNTFTPSYPIAENVKVNFCPRCGIEINGEKIFCGRCGTKLLITEKTPIPI